MSTLFVVFEGKNEEGVPNPAALFTDEATARSDFNDTVTDGLADLNTGLYLGRLDNLTTDEVDRVYQELLTLADEGFEDCPGFVLLDSYGSNIEDWDDDSLDVGADEEYDSEESFVVSRVVVGEVRETEVAPLASGASN